MKLISLRAAACVAAASLALCVSLRISADESKKATKGGNAAQFAGAPAPDRRASRGLYLARTALAYRGAPYRWGGRSARTGFDCSGLVQSVYAHWGLYLPRTAHVQFSVGKPVAKSALLPGDLVFFRNTYKRGISHVGLYVGEGFFVHAPGAGKPVMLSRLNGAYHARHYAGARRLDLSRLPKAPGEDAPPRRVVVEDAPASDASGQPSTLAPATGALPGSAAPAR